MTCEVGLSRSVRAFHIMPGLPGPEGQLHDHDYRIEIVVDREQLDARGMVCDLDLLEAALTELTSRVTSRLYPAPGYPQRTQRLRAVRALGLRAGDSVIDMACGTGLNFPLLEEVIGPDGRIVGVDLTDAMHARAQDRIKANGWSNVSLVQADAAGFDFPAEVDAILSTYALTQVPECAEVIAHGAAALSAGGR